jgi:hypothetical protein
VQYTVHVAHAGSPGDMCGCASCCQGCGVVLLALGCKTVTMILAHSARVGVTVTCLSKTLAKLVGVTYMGLDLAAL